MNVRLLLKLTTLLFAAFALVACGESRTEVPSVDVPDAGDDDDDTVEPPPTDEDPLSLTRVVPASGPNLGGNAVVVRGTGFVDGAEVFFGDKQVNPPDVEVIDAFRIGVLSVPSGPVGAVNVTVRIGDEPDDEVVLSGAYRYESFAVDPPEGSIAGGTRITLTGTDTDWTEGDAVRVGGQDCGDLQIESPSVMSCRTPPGEAGAVDVIVVDGDEGTEDVAADAFLYLDTASTRAGGLGGTEIEGALNVTVINAEFGTREADVFVMVGDDPDTTPFRSFTDSNGQAVFSGDFEPPVTLHAVKDCFERTTFVSFNARDVTIFLVPWEVPPGHRCAPPPSPGPLPPGGPPGLNSTVAGELVFLGPEEFGPNPWNNIPEPSRGYERAAYVYTTQVCEGSSFGCQNPLTDPNPLSPNPALTPRVLEVPPTDPGARGYPYRILTRPGTYAVYALAGLEIPPTIDPATGATTRGDFIPYVMGVARNVIAGPGDNLTGVDIVMDIPLDSTLDVRATELPDGLPGGPNLYRSQAYVDLGAEGFISRTPGTTILFIGGGFLFFPYLLELPTGLDVVERRFLEDFRFFAQPALTGELSDARYRITTGWYTGGFRGTPYTERLQTGIRDTSGTVEVDDFLSIPVATDPPSPGGALPSDRVLRWSLDGDDPDFFLLLLQGSDGFPAWRIFVPGSERQATIPDLDSIETLRDLPGGNLSWAIFAARIPDFNFNTVTYRDLSQRRWSHSAVNQFTASVPLD